MGSNYIESGNCVLGSYGNTKVLRMMGWWARGDSNYKHVHDYIRCRYYLWYRAISIRSSEVDQTQRGKVRKSKFAPHVERMGQAHRVNDSESMHHHTRVFYWLTFRLSSLHLILPNRLWFV